MACCRIGSATSTKNCLWNFKRFSISLKKGQKQVREEETFMVTNKKKEKGKDAQPY